MKMIPFHPAAELFPLMPDKELNELAVDIRENGLLQPIIIHDGKILDGRNRFNACRKACVAPKFADWTGTGSPTAWVLSVNLHRRHLTPSQKAVIARKALPAFEAEAKERQISALRKGDSTPVKEIIPERDKGQARDQAAAVVGVNPRYVSDVKTIEEKAPELIQKIEAGEISVPQAKKIANHEPPKQIWDAGSVAERPEKHKPEDNDSDGLWHLKQSWRKANKKEKTAFLNWVEESGFKVKTK